MDTKRYGQNLLGLVLFPLCISTTVAFLQEVIKKAGWTYNMAYFFLVAAVYLLIHLFFHEPIVAYVTGHELTHALWGFLFGAKIKKMKVGKSGGSVSMTKSNFLVSLAPYVFPIYTFLIMGLYFILNFFWPEIGMASATIFLIGFTLSFHVVLSLYAVRIRQSDLQPAGFLLSTVLIYLANLFVLGIIFTLISQRISLGSFLSASLGQAEIIYRRIIAFIAAAVEMAREYVRTRRS
jgi:hypothetical protein